MRCRLRLTEFRITTSSGHYWFGARARIPLDQSGFDLRSALSQTRASFHHTLEEVVKTTPARLSIFNYAHLPSRFAGQHKIKDETLPPAAEKLAMLQDTIEFLTAEGYQYIGMDHFAYRMMSWLSRSGKASCIVTSRAIPSCWGWGCRRSACWGMLIRRTRRI